MAGPTYNDQAGYDPDTGYPTYNPDDGLPTYCPGGCVPGNLEELESAVITITYTLSGCTGDSGACPDTETTNTLTFDKHETSGGTEYYYWKDGTEAILMFSYANQFDCYGWTLQIIADDIYPCWIGYTDNTPGNDRLYDGEAIEMQDPPVVHLCTGPASITVNWA